MEENTEQRVDLTLFSEKIQELKDRIASVIVGQEQTVDLVLTAILANGHVLIFIRDRFLRILYWSMKSTVLLPRHRLPCLR